MAGLRVETGPTGVAVVTLDRPHRMNALDDDLFDELPRALDELAGRPDVRAVVITGAGRAFCAGADLDCSGFGQPSPTEAEAYMRASHRTPIRIRTMPQPTIAAVGGPAVGAGFGLALACDFRFASAQGSVGSPFISMGLVPDFGVTYFLPRLIGPDKALELLLTGRMLGAEEAFAAGLVSRLCDDVVAESVAFATVLAQAPPAAVAMTRRNVYRSLELTLDAEVLEAEVRAQALALFGSEFQERFSVWKNAIQS
jgi:enoyl-CoA hydratase/carnithine racemase